MTNIAVFFDYENAPVSASGVREILTILEKQGRLVVRRAYADWGRHESVKSALRECAIELAEMPSSTNGKNAADIRLTVDVMEIALTRPHIAIIVLIAGDSDYLPLIARLREHNKRVIVVARKASASKLLSGFCDELLYYDALIPSALPPAAPQKPSPAKLIRKTPAKPASKPAPPAIDLEPAFALIQRAVTTLKAEGKDPVSTAIGQYIRRIDPEFTCQRYGVGQLKRLLKAAQEQGRFSLETTETGHYRVVEPKQT